MCCVSIGGGNMVTPGACATVQLAKKERSPEVRRLGVKTRIHPNPRTFRRRGMEIETARYRLLIPSPTCFKKWNKFYIVINFGYPSKNKAGTESEGLPRQNERAQPRMRTGDSICHRDLARRSTCFGCCLSSCAGTRIHFRCSAQRRPSDEPARASKDPS